MFYQWQIINFNVFRETSGVFKTCNRCNKNLHFSIWMWHLERGCFLCRNRQIWSLPNSKAYSLLSLFLHSQLIPFLCNYRKSLQNLRNITVMGSYFYQITIKNAPRHKLLEEKLKNFPIDNLIFTMVRTQTYSTLLISFHIL